MDNNKKLLIMKNQNQTQYQTVHQTQKNITKQNEQNPNLSESGTTIIKFMEIIKRQKRKIIKYK